MTCTVTESTTAASKSWSWARRRLHPQGRTSRDRSEPPPDRFAPGEKGDAKVTQVDAKTRRLTLSIKALEVEEEKKAMAEFGSSDSGASLGDILGAALQEKKAKAAAKKKTDDDDAKPKKAKKAKKDDADE